MLNKLKRFPKELQRVLEAVCDTAAYLNMRVYLVGGVVRDLLLQRPIFDLDIAVEGDAIVLTQSLAQTLGSSFRRHHSFGTATLVFGSHNIDLATARTEHYAHSGALPRVRPARLADDLFRRDFTINAMALSLNRGDYGRLIDLYGGMSDLKNKTLRILHEKSFFDDPTRILRAVRFEQRFSFKFERRTFSFMKKAVEAGALMRVSKHRLRDELILILQEEKPGKYIKRLNEITGFVFVSPVLKLSKMHFDFFKRTESALAHYQAGAIKHHHWQNWLIYLGGVLASLPASEFEKILHEFAFKKKERIALRSMREGLRPVAQLNRAVKPHVLYRCCLQFSIEALLFFYAYYSDKVIRKNIDYFLTKQINKTLRIRGRDLKRLGLKPQNLYGRVFEELLNKKLDYGFSSKSEELKEAVSIFNKISRKS